ncbi:cadherin repeat domain-containing protein, partial [Cylindrospermopsis raciborskii CS-506_B]
MLIIEVINVNETPTNISLNATTVDENIPTNTVIGTFSTTDPDAGNTFTYSLVGGDTDNSVFSIVDN